ncbi:MAG: hypothetical protein WAO74_05520 [Polaribacter sp.]|uniref:hypothetical protein n=1 Tax=Polaribacter sp. TaxID=1920175 RepID=UPI003BAFD9B5
MSSAILTIVQNQLNENLSTQLLFSTAENVVFFILIAMAIFLIISTPVVLFYFSVDNYFKLKKLKKIIDIDICCKNSRTHNSFKAETCSSYINSYALFIGNIVGLIIWNVLSFIYIFSQNQSTLSGILSYLKFPFEILENYDFNNALSSISSYKYNWIMMSGILIGTLLSYVTIKYFTENMIRNKVSKNIKTYSLT